MDYIIFLLHFSTMRYVLATFAILTAYLFYILRHKNCFSYAKEKQLFKDFRKNTFIPQTNIDWIALILFLVYLTILFWNIFYKIDARHSDATGIIDGIICRNHFVAPWFFSGRFFPLATQEYNILAGIIRLFNCSYAYTIAYSLSFSLLLMAVYYLNKIIPFEKLWQRVFAVFFITIDLGFFSSFSNIIIPDRNTIFLLILFIYNIIQFYKTNNNRNFIFSLICVNISLYIKESMFLFYSGFALTFLIFKITENKISLITIIKKPLNFTKKYPLEVSVLFLSLFFVIGYTWFVLFKNPTSFYGFTGNNVNYFRYLYTALFDYPLFVIILATISIYIKDFKTLKHKNLIISLFIGGLLYALFMTSMRSTYAYYYYSIASLSIIISACYYLVDKKKSKVFIIFLIIIVMFCLKSNLTSDINRSISDKIMQNRIHALRENFKLEKGKKYKIFYYERKTMYGNYWGATMFALFKSVSHEESPFYLYTFHGCYTSNYGKKGDNFRCFKVDNFDLNKYNVIIFDRESIPANEWLDLTNKHGDKMKKITNYPEFLHVNKKRNLYIIYNTNGKSPIITSIKQKG